MMQNFTGTKNCISMDPTWFKQSSAAVGHGYPKMQAKLAEKMQLQY
jgi:hypothetical protein